MKTLEISTNKGVTIFNYNNSDLTDGNVIITNELTNESISIPGEHLRNFVLDCMVQKEISKLEAANYDDIKIKI